jgi:WD40 repeat protein
MRTLLLCLLFSLAAQGVVAAPDDAAAKPRFRVNPGSHVATLTDLALDSRGERAYSVSHDKSVRAWRVSDLAPLAVGYAPMESGRNGQLTAVALSADGRHLAVGAWGAAHGAVHLFEAARLGLLRSIDLPAGVTHLRSAAAGRFVACLNGGGLRLLDPMGAGQLAQTEYSVACTGLDVAADGRIAAAFADGAIRLFGPDLRELARNPAGGHAGPLRFAPDGTRLLVGDLARPRAAVLDSRTLAVLGSTDLPETQWRAVTQVDWSVRGDALLLAQDNLRWRGAVLRWNPRTTAPPALLTPAGRRLERFVPTSTGMLLAAADHSLLRSGLDGQTEAESTSGALVFPDGLAALALSADANAVSFAVRRDGTVRARFAVREVDYATGEPEQPELQRARQNSSRLVLEGWREPRPRLNGRPLELDSDETLRGWGFAADDAYAVIGTDSKLRAYTPAGRLIWQVPVAAAATSVAVSADGRYVVAALADGTLRWFAARNGEERLALFAHRNRRDWVLWRPDGYYAASDFGDTLAGWQVTGTGKEPRYYQAVQFERLFYRPDLLRNQLADAPPLLAPARNSIDRFADIAPPHVRVLAAEVDGKGQLDLRFAAETVGPDMREAIVFIDDVPVTPVAERAIAADGRRRLERSVRLALPPGESLLRIEVHNDIGFGLAEERLTGPGRAAARSLPGGTLYVLAVGVNHFDAGGSKSLPTLEFAERDAQEIARALGSRAGKQFADVRTRVLSDSESTKPTRGAILEAMRFWQQAGANDAVVLFLASHGITDRVGNYYFVPRDARRDDVEAVLGGRNDSGEARSLLGWRELLDGLARSAGQRLLIVDTCKASSAEGALAASTLRKRSAASRFPLLLAARAEEDSQEYRPARHGLFTHTLLQALTGRADQNRDRSLSVLELHGYAAPQVQALHDPRAGPQNPQVVAPERLLTRGLFNY